MGPLPRLLAASLLLAAHACVTNLDCWHNGVCSQQTRQCACHAAWQGAACNVLKQGPSTQLWPNPAHPLPAAARVTDSWGATVGQEADGTWVGYFCVACVFSGGKPQPFSMHGSGIVAARAPALEGPYEFAGQFEGVFSEGPHMTRSADGRTWVLITPSANASALAPVACTGDYATSQAALPPALALPRLASTVNKSSLFSAPSPGGPWAAHNFSVAQRDIQTYFSNPSIALGPSGEGLLAWRVNLAGARRGESIGFAAAPAWAGPLYTALAEPLTPGLVGAEDPFVWRHEEPSDAGGGANVSVLSILFHAQTGALEDVGGLFVSVDGGASWLRSPAAAYGTRVPAMVGPGWDGGAVTFARRERPELHFDAATGQPTHLLTGVMLPNAGPGKAWQLSYSIATRLG
jgi:hypothetical protein